MYRRALAYPFFITGLVFAAAAVTSLCVAWAILPSGEQPIPDDVNDV